MVSSAVRTRPTERAMRRLAWAVPVVALSAGLVGCGPDGYGAAPPQPRPTTKTGATGPVEVTEVSAGALAAALKEQKGTVVLADFWATWCEPCIEGFPHVVGLHKKYADKGLTCLSVSMDLEGVPGEYRKDTVLDFLTRHGATFPNFVLLDPKGGDTRATLEAGFGKGF